MTEEESRTAACLALGRLFRIGSRPFQEGDLEEWENIRRVVLEASEVLNRSEKAASLANHARP